VIGRWKSPFSLSNERFLLLAARAHHQYAVQSFQRLQETSWIWLVGLKFNPHTHHAEKRGLHGWRYLQRSHEQTIKNQLNRCMPEFYNETQKRSNSSLPILYLGISE